MDFELNENQQEFCDLAQRFAQRELLPYAAKWDEDALFPIDTIKKAGKLGFCSLYCDEAQGGMGLSRLDASLIFEQLAAGCTATTAYITIHNMVAWIINRFATETARKQFLPKLVIGDHLGSYCLTEPHAGSDAGSLQMQAVLINNEYRLNGSKIFISGAGSTDTLVVMARTGQAGTKGISAFIVPATTTGIHYGKKENKMGWRCQPTREVIFDNVYIPKTYRLGEEGKGFHIAMQGLDGGRINIAACSVGTAQQALNTARKYMQTRRQFGCPLTDFQGLQFKLADMNTELVAARQLVRLAAAKLDIKHESATVYCAMAKRFSTDISFNVCNQALQIHGGYGYMKDFPLERYVRDVRVHQILEGTNEIMRVIIARHLLLESITEEIL